MRSHMLVAAGVFLAMTLPASAQAQDDVYDFWLSESFVKELASQHTIRFAIAAHMNERSSRVHRLGSDCEIHIAATPTSTIAWPKAIVVEPPNFCKLRAAGMPAATSEQKLRDELWPAFLDANIMGRTCTVAGYPRLFTEHASGTGGANPDHIVEIHPALSFACGDTTYDFTPFLRVFEGMPHIQDQTTSNCIRERKLQVRRENSRYEFKEEGGQCGNFAIVQARINPAWIRAISGGHSAIARVLAGNEGPFTLKLYTYAGTPEDDRLAAIQADADTSNDPLMLQGLFTYDYFSILKATRDQSGQWLAVDHWTPVDFPLALVVFGSAIINDE
jgi:hypothetical protein